MIDIDNKAKIIKPFLKWAGGKRQLIPELKRYSPKKYVTYYEPFVGAGALLFDLLPPRAIINDSNPDLMNCYLVIRNSLDTLISVLAKHEKNKTSQDYFYKIRDMDRDENYQNSTPEEKAARTIFLNKTCYNGLFRVNSQGYFNAPFGRYKNPNILDYELLYSVHEYLNNNDIVILNNDFENAIKTAVTGDFIYFDPPYDPISKTSSFTSYNINGFNRAEQIRLSKVYTELDKRGCHVMLSNSCTDFILDLYKDYKIHKIQAKRAINSKGTGRGKVDELLILNY